MRTLWFGMFISIVLYYGLTLFVGPREETTSNDLLSLIFLIVGVSTMLISFPIKSRLVNQAIEQQRVPLVQQAYVLAFALCEVPALLGLLDFFATGHRHYYILFLIAALGSVLHFPRREHVVNASSRTPIV